jgi:carbonic anhydrase
VGSIPITRFIFWRENMLRCVRQYGLFVVLAMLSGYTCAAANWGYKGNVGPEFWGRLSPAYKLCAEGKSQSPIDIAKNDASAVNTLVLHYQEAPLIEMKDGKTQLLIGDKKTIFNDGHTIQVNYRSNENEWVSYESHKYQLRQFHFHSPSESQINGESASLEIHFVHQGDHGRVLVVGVLINGGDENPVLQTIIDHFPTVADGKEHVISGVKLNPQDLFPLDSDYYSFMGSLTTPPCTEGLHWVVMASHITASPAQIAEIRQALGGANARAVQSLNGRKITYSQGKS